jgi:hypothetical protein
MRGKEGSCGVSANEFSCKQYGNGEKKVIVDVESRKQENARKPWLI